MTSTNAWKYVPHQTSRCYCECHDSDNYQMFGCMCECSWEDKEKIAKKLIAEKPKIETDTLRKQKKVNSEQP